jgi:hypothetical protein
MLISINIIYLLLKLKKDTFNIINIIISINKHFR